MTHASSEYSIKDVMHLTVPITVVLYIKYRFPIQSLLECSDVVHSSFVLKKTVKLATTSYVLIQNHVLFQFKASLEMHLPKTYICI